ncbi:MAG TPA: polymorphic toxin type 23 domain-containing protein [Luteibaculaceae bacterium]|nr:polymorphic toxin type 23 domain-containing protein [Luteibaculaceae bacterium]
MSDATCTVAYNRFLYANGNPLKFTDPNGEVVWFAPLIFAAVNVGVDLVLNEGKMNIGEIAMSAGMGALAGLTSGATTVGGAFMTAGVGKLNRLLPSANIPITDNISISVSVGVGVGSTGFSGGGNFSATYQGEKGSLSLGFGGGYNGTGNYSGYSVSATRGDWGLGYHRTSYSGSNSQVVGGLKIAYKNSSFRIENDFMGDGHDRWRSNAAEISVGDFIVGTNLYNNDPAGEGQGTIDLPNRVGKYNKHGYKAWQSGKVYSSPLWLGYKTNNSVYRFGKNDPMVQDRTQNWTHKNGFFWLPMGYQNYYLDDSEFNYAPHYYGGYNSPYSLW